VNSEQLEKLRTEYQAGKAEFEKGNYRQAVDKLEKAIALTNENSRLGGEIQMWLVTAYEAAGQKNEAMSLCRQLKRHPDIETRKQSKRVLYILEAPQLNRPPEWLTQIPDLKEIEEADSRYRQAVGGGSISQPASSQPKTSEPIDLSQVETKDNSFLWIGLVASVLILTVLAWMASN
jgi:tetratricopeptide (TPR) repeat protein